MAGRHVTAGWPPLPNAALWVVSVAALVATLGLPAVSHACRAHPEVGALLLAAALAIALLRVVPARPRRNLPGTTGHMSRTRSVVDLGLHLWPVALLSLLYPVVSIRMAGITVGGVELTVFLLAVSLTVPWLSQGACMPLYRAVGALRGASDADALRARMCMVWPAAILQALPAVLLFALPVGLLTDWPLQTMLAYAVSCSLHLVFAQSLVVTNLVQARVTWALVWTCYALPLAVAPSLWFLPPLAGLAAQLIVLRRTLWVRPAGLDLRDTARDLTRGLLLGSVLWADKLFFFMAVGAALPVTAVFMALLPAVLAYNYYFIRLTPTFDTAVASFRASMEQRPASESRRCPPGCIYR